MSAAGSRMRPVLIMAGGTGGHVFPALAVARELTALGVPVCWLGTRRGLEAKVVPAAGYPLSLIRVTGLRGKGVLRLLLAPFMLLLAMLQSLLVFLRLRPVAVLGMGGFTAGPGGVIAWLLRRPLLIHEQNSVAGTTNRLLAPLARTVMGGLISSAVFTLLALPSLTLAVEGIAFSYNRSVSDEVTATEMSARCGSGSSMPSSTPPTAIVCATSQLDSSKVICVGSTTT